MREGELGIIAVYTLKPCLAVLDVDRGVVRRELFLDEWPGSFSETAFTSDDSALFAFEQASQQLYRLELPGATPKPVYTLTGDLRGGTLPAV